MREQIYRSGRATLVATLLVIVAQLYARAQTYTAGITLAINTAHASAMAIPGDFSGLSFEMGSVIYDSVNIGWYLSATNSAMVTLLKTMGVKSVRVGGNSAETGNIATNADEDAVLDFCHAIGGNLIWDLEIDGNLYDPPGKAVIAQSMHNYVKTNGYGTNVLVFQIGNEPDLMPDPVNPSVHMTVKDYDTEFSNYVAAVNGLYPGQMFAGPDTSGGGTFYSATFCPYFGPGGQIAYVCQHDYPFGSSLDTNTTAVHISWMLAANNEAGYQSFNNQWVPPAMTAGLAPRYEECNSFFHNGSFGASDAYASALWGLGWMYFQANAGVAGINFHTGENANNPAYNAITPANLTTNYTVHPLAYAIKAFDLGGQGRIVPVTMGNPSNVNVVAYSVLQNDGSLMLTVINREYVSQPSPPAYNAALDITTSGTTYNDGQVMFLAGMNDDPATTNGVTLGGSGISGTGGWTGTYMGMARPSGSSFALTVPAAQAAIIHLFNAAGPAAPTNLTATTGSSQAALIWSNSAGATGYVVQRSGTTGGPYATIASGVTTNAYTDTGLTNGLIYYYVVAATNINGIGPQSAEGIASLSTAPPPAPTGLTAVAGDTVVALSWNPSPGATNYVVQGSTNDGAGYFTITTTPYTSYLNTGLADGTTYYYVVSAVSPYGESAASPAVSGTPFVSTGIAWTNTTTASPQSWNVNSNWSNGTAFPNNTQAVALVNAPIIAAQTINLNQSITLGELNLGAASGAAAFNLAGNGGSLVFNNAPGPASLTQLGSSAGDTISAPLTMSGALNVNNTAAMPLTLSGVITGTNNLVLTGGTVVLGGANTFGGATIIAQGTLEVANSLALQNSTLDYTNGSLAFNGITAATLGGIGGTQGLSLVNLASSPLALTVGANDANTVYAGAFSGSGVLAKAGTGTLTLTGTNVHAGGTTILGGNLTVAGGAFGTSGSTITVGNGATGVSFTVTNAFVTANSLNVAPNANSTGDNVTIAGSGSTIFNSVNLGGTGDTSGPLTINTSGSVGLGTFIDYKDVEADSPASATSGLIIKQGTVTATSIIIGNTTSGNNSANLNLNGGSLTIGNAASSGAFKIGNNNGGRGAFLAMTGGSLTYLGTDGLLLNTVSGSLNSVVLTGGTATLTGVTVNQANAASATSSLTVLNSATLYLGNVGLVINQPGSMAYISLGNATLAAITNWSSSAPMTLTGGTTNQAADARGVPHNIVMTGVLSGTGGLTKTGGGTLTLGGANTFSGGMVVMAGALLVNGTQTGGGPVTVGVGGTLSGKGAINGPVTVQSGGMFIPGTSATGTLTISNSLTLAAGSTSILEISSAPLASSAANISGELTCGGTLVITNVGAAALAAGDSFKLFSAASYKGAFASVIFPPLPAGLGWNTNALGTSGTLSVTVVARPLITSVAVSGNGFMFTGAGGVANANFYLLGSTNLAVPVTNWMRLLTNQFDNSGNFNFNFTNAAGTNAQTFYLLQLQ